MSKTVVINIIAVILALIMGYYLISSAKAQDIEFVYEGYTQLTTEALEIEGPEIEVLKIEYIRCSNVSSVCINYIYPNRTHCEMGRPKTEDCVAVNVIK